LNFRNGDTDTFTFGSYTLATGGQYLFNVKPAFISQHPKYAQLESFSVRLQKANGVALTHYREFSVTEDIDSPVSVLFMNRLGGWDFCYFQRDYVSKIKTTNSVFSNSYAKRTFQVSTDTTTTYNSGWLTKAEYAWLIDLSTSPLVYVNGSYYRKEDTTIELDTSLGLFNIELSVKPEYEENTIKL
jgi:hypothetical protein